MPDPVVPPAGTPPAPPVVTPPAPTDWAANLAPDLKGFIQERGFKDPGEIAEQYRNLEKLRGVPADKLLKLPDSLDDMTNMAPIYDRLGRPKDAKGYTIEVPKEGGDPKQAEWAAELFHKAGLTKAQGEAIGKAWNERQTAAFTSIKESTALAKTQAEAALRTEWGAAYDQNVALVDKGANTLGLTKDQIESMGNLHGRDVFMKKLAEIGRSLGEANFVPGNKTPGGAMEPEQAQNTIKELMRSEEFTKRLNSGDPDARKRWDGLHEMAFRGSANIYS